MTSAPRKRAAAAAATLPAILLLTSLTGCSAVSDALYGEASHEFSSHDQMVEQWSKEAPWLPADASSILIREKTDGDPASLTADSATPLDPELCGEVERRSASTFALDNTPDVFKIDRVYACGDWAVVATDDGWYGWTPNHPDEQAQSPAP